jgi:hypothetical protein
LLDVFIPSFFDNEVIFTRGKPSSLKSDPGASF